MQKKNYKNVYQFKITLKNAKPPIWRRIQVPENYNFWELHVAIQDAMGWHDYHLHEFTSTGKDREEVKIIGIPDTEMRTSDVLPGWKENISDWFSLSGNKSMDYMYDFGDGWEHIVELENVTPKEKKINYPICAAGERACPPEDCGGTWSYEKKLDILKNPKHPEYNETLEWMGDDFDSEEFDCSEVFFENPASRLENSGLMDLITEEPENLEQEKTEGAASPKMDWEIDYSELPYALKDDNDSDIKPLILMIVHPESFFIINSHLASPKDNYLQEFTDKILDSIKNSPLHPQRILIKKKELFDLVSSALKDKDIKTEMVTRTKTVDSVKKSMFNFFKNR